MGRLLYELRSLLTVEGHPPIHALVVEVCWVLVMLHQWLMVLRRVPILIIYHEAAMIKAIRRLHMRIMGQIIALLHRLGLFSKDAIAVHPQRGT
jgi:hypothetical protein